MPQAKVRFLNVRPIQSADLSFNLSGIIDFRDDRTAQLGMRLNRFDASTVYDRLSNETGNGQLECDGAKIRKMLADDMQAVLFAVRNPALESSLLHAVCRRQNAFLQRYKHKNSILQEYTQLYNNADPESKLEKLSSLHSRAKERHDELKNEYESVAGRDGVISESQTKTSGGSDGTSESSGKTSSLSESDALSTNNTTSSATSTESSKADQKGSGEATTKQRPLAYRSFNQISKTRDSDDLNKPVKQRIDSENSDSRPMEWNGTDWAEVKREDVSLESQKTISTNSATTTSKGESKTSANSEAKGTSNSKTTSSSTQTGQGKTNSSFSQEASTLLTEFRHPSAENDLRWYRRELDLQDERLSHTLFGLQVPEMETILDNELKMLDQEVRQLQLNYMHTFLTPSISGLVTAIYKDRGEFVAAGEPVMRIEDDTEILMVGVVNHRAPLRVGLPVTIKLHNPYEQAGAADSIELSGQLAAVRGHSADNDEWEIIIRADNSVPGSASARRLPLNYVVQREDVELTIG